MMFTTPDGRVLSMQQDWIDVSNGALVERIPGPARYYIDDREVSEAEFRAALEPQP